jgi:hypothetical protein
MFKVVLYKNAYGYSIPCSNRREGWKAYLNAKFYDCTPPDNNCEIYINEGGFGCYKNKTTNNVTPTVIIKDYTIVRVFEDQPKTDTATTTRTDGSAYKSKDKQSVGGYETGSYEDGLKHYHNQLKGQVSLEEVEDDGDLPF